MSRQDKMKKSRSGSNHSSISSFASGDELDDSHRKIKKNELKKPHNADFFGTISQGEYTNGAQLESAVAGTMKDESRTFTNTNTVSLSTCTPRSSDTSLSLLSEDDNDHVSCSSASAQPTTLRACTETEQMKYSNSLEQGHRDEANTTECEFTTYPILSDTQLHRGQQTREKCQQIVVIEPPLLLTSPWSTRTLGSHSISNDKSKTSLNSMEIPNYHYGEDSYIQSSSSSSSSRFVSRKTFKELRRRLQQPRKHRKKEKKAVNSSRKNPSFHFKQTHHQCYLHNDASIKSCLKSSPSSRGDTNHDGSGDDHRVSFGTIEIREYERTIGDNPSCTSGPPLAIGWRFVPVTETVTTDDQESLSANAATATTTTTVANHKTVDQYEMQRQDQRRSGIDLKLPCRYREDLLRDEWDVSPRAIRIAQYEARQVQQQRIDSYHYCYLEKVQSLAETIRKMIKRRYRKEKEKMLKDVLEYSQSKSVSTLNTTQEEEDEEFRV